jgi:hypothetical protein
VRYRRGPGGANHGGGETKEGVCYITFVYWELFRSEMVVFNGANTTLGTYLKEPAYGSTVEVGTGI